MSDILTLQNSPRDVIQNNNILDLQNQSRTGVNNQEEPELSNQTLEVGDYSANDLIENDRFYKPIEKYMSIRFGIGPERNFSRRDIVNRYLNNMRGFAGGNSIRAINEISFLNSLKSDDEKDMEDMAAVGEAYTIFEGMETLFGKTTGGEKLEILGDYIREGVFDPVNLLGFGLGKLWSSGATKVATRLAQKEAMKAYTKSLSKQGVSKITATETQKKTALKLAEKEWGKVMQSSAIKANNTTVKNRAAKMGVGGSMVEKHAKNMIKKEIIANLGVDTAAAIGTTLAYENGMVRATGRESNYAYASGMAALGVMTFGGLQTLASIKMSKLGGRPKLTGKEDLGTGPEGQKFSRKTYTFRDALGTEDLALPMQDVQKPEKFNLLGSSTEGGPSIMESIQRNANQLDNTNSWKDKVAEGKEIQLSDFGDTLIRELIIGNDEKNLKGLVHVMLNQGFSIRERYAGDNVGNFIADLVKTADPKDVQKFFKDFEKAVGATVYTSLETGKPRRSVSTFTPEDFSNVIAEWGNRSAVNMNALSQIKRTLNPETLHDDFTFKQYADSLNDVGLANATLGKSSSVFKGKLGGAFERGIKTFAPDSLRSGQNKIIRLLVSSPSTSYLNLLGWGAASGINSVTDMGLALTFMGKGVRQYVLNNGDANESFRIAGAYWKSNRQKMRNLLDPNMTYDAFKSISMKDPELLRSLTRVIPGGVEDLDLLIKQNGFNPNETVAGAGFEAATDLIQSMGLVKLQDSFTKSQEFVHQLDKNLRLTFNKSWSEFYTDPNAARLMNTAEYKTAVARASEETQRAIFSLSFKSRETTLGELAGLVEDARNIPGVGLLVPFGRFFNNTLAFTSDMSGLSFATKFLRPEEKRSARELAVRAAIGLGLAYTLAEDEEVYRKQGFAFDQKPDHLKLPFLGTVFEGTGAVREEKYNFPTSHFKAAGRLLSYVGTPETMPAGEYEQILQVVGPAQITRQLNQAIEGWGNLTKELVEGNIGPGSIISKTFGNTGSQIFSGATRFLDPYNGLLGLVMGENFKVTDKKDGTEFKKMLLNGSRYVDQFINLLSKDSLPEKESDVIGTARNQASKNLGVREVKLTDTAKLMNIVGLGSWEANIDSKFGVARNAFSRLFHELAEYKSRELLQSERFRKGDYLNMRLDVSDNNIQDMQRKLVKDMFESVRADVQTAMLGGVETMTGKFNPELFAIGKLIKLESKYGVDTLTETFEKLVDRGDIQPRMNKKFMTYDTKQQLEDADLTQLGILESFLNYNVEVDKVYESMN